MSRVIQFSLVWHLRSIGVSQEQSTPVLWALKGVGGGCHPAGFRKRSKRGIADLISRVPISEAGQCHGQCGHCVRVTPGDRCLGMGAWMLEALRASVSTGCGG